MFAALKSQGLWKFVVLVFVNHGPQVEGYSSYNQEGQGG